MKFKNFDNYGGIKNNQWILLKYSDGTYRTVQWFVNFYINDIQRNPGIQYVIIKPT